jgi:hypothetical protein
MTRQWVVGTVIVLITAVVLWATLTSRQNVRGTQPAANASAPLSAMRSSQGKLSITYTRQESSSTRSDSTITDVTAVEFYPGFILYRTKNGGSLLPLDKIWHFSWSGSAD